MLAKIWKKVLLIICIIACLFNITYKIVNKTSLKVELQSIVGGESLSSIFKNKDKEKKQSEFIEGIKDTIQTQVQQKTDSQQSQTEENQNNGDNQMNQAEVQSDENTPKYVVVY